MARPSPTGIIMLPEWKSRRSMTNPAISILGVDLGKNSCSVAGLDATGAVVMRRRMTREGLIRFVSKLPQCVVAMEACCGAHFLSRIFVTQGHVVRLMSPEYVQHYVKAPENRRPGCRGYHRSRDPSDNAPGDAEKRSAAGFTNSASGASEAGCGANTAHQPIARGLAGAWHHPAATACSSDPATGRTYVGRTCDQRPNAASTERLARGMGGP